VIAGILINLLSAYLKSPLDKILASTSAWWRRKSEARRQAWEMRIDLIRSSDKVRNATALLEIRHRLQSITMLLLAIFMLILPLFVMNFAGERPQRLVTVFSFGSSAFTFFGAFLAFKAAGNTRNLLYEANESQ